MIRLLHLFIFFCLLVPAMAQKQKKDRRRFGEVLDDVVSGDVKENFRTRVRIAGVKTISENDALGLIGDRLEHVRRQAPSASRASDAAFMARQLFRSHGFNECEVTWQIAGANMIQLTVKEGPRQQLGTVIVEGVDSENAKRLAKLYASPAEKRSFGFGQKAPFREPDVQDGIELVTADFRSRGYWLATVELKEKKIDPEKGYVNITLATKPGALHTIGNPTIQGSSRGDEVAVVARGFTGRVADTAGVNGLRAAVETWYRQRGFTKAKIQLTQTLSDGKFIPGLIIDEGKSYQLGTIRFTGLQKTKPWRLRQRFGDMEGKTLDDTVMEKRQRGLMATGAFEAVRMQTVQRGENIIDATLQFEEGNARGYTGSVGLGSYEGPIFGVAYYDRNFRGMLWNFNSGFEITARSLLGEVTLTDPWLWGTDASGSARLFLFTRDNEGYSNWKTGLEAGVSYPLTDHYTLDLKAGWTIVNSNSDGIPGPLMGETVYQNPYLRFNQRWEYRDSAVLPTKGWRVELPIELGSALGEVSSGYLKSELSGSWYRAVGTKGQVALGARGGVLMPTGDNDDFPIDLRFFTGGPRSVRSFQERELGPKANGYPIGGESYWVTNAEYIHSVSGPFKVVGFVDAGALSREWQDFGGSETNVAAGLGVRFDLPVGPVRLEYGHNMTRREGEPSGTWHFAIGIAF